MREPLSSTVIPAPGGKFSFPVNDTVVRGVLVYLPDDTRGRKYGTTSFIYVPGEYARISGTLDRPVFDGSAYYRDKGIYDDMCRPYVDKIDALGEEYKAAVSASNQAKADSLTEEYSRLSDSIDEVAKDFIRSHPSSPYSATIISKTVGEDGKDALELISLLPDKVKNGPLKPIVDQTEQSARRAFERAEASKKVQDSMAAPDFTLKNEKGADFTLSSIFNQGKYIILDFWGEWCYWCKKGIPDMKQLYKDAKGKIEILSIDCRDTEEVWKKAIKEHDLPWLHVYNPGDDKVDLAKTYAIQGYPTKIILNPDGTINKTVVGEDPEFYSYVRSLIKK
ncbi:MAG: TlpA family protein disulfide reductase [Bacteroidales bacterium]|nr:TlpA family protein disulfide reductase [Bacteroidales bacterium]